MFDLEHWFAVSKRQMSTLIGGALALWILHMRVFETGSVWQWAAAMVFGTLCYWTGRRVLVSCSAEAAPPDYRIFDKKHDQSTQEDEP
jgi:hypothetical protein